MAKYIFISKPDDDNKFEHTSIMVKTSSPSLGDIVEAFEGFLRANGFAFDGYLDIIQDDFNTENGGDGDVSN